MIYKGLIALKYVWDDGILITMIKVQITQKKISKLISRFLEWIPLVKCTLIIVWFGVLRASVDKVENQTIQHAVSEETQT